MKKVNVLFVCMGNICRSPTAEGVFTRLVAEEGLESLIAIDSAGTHAYHVGEPPDRRSQAAARARGIELGGLRARQVSGGDFERFDYILAMDGDNHDNLLAHCPREHAHKVVRFLDFAPETQVSDVPDPYYGGPHGFEQVLDLVTAASRGLLAHIRASHLVGGGAQ